MLVLALAVVVLDRAGLAGDDVSRGWFAAGVIAVTVLWLLGQVLAATRGSGSRPSRSPSGAAVPRGER